MIKIAATSIWSVKGWLGRVVIYVENPEKTQNPKFYQEQDMPETSVQGLIDVINYAARSNKTLLADEGKEIMRRFVTGVNCQAETARDEMMAVKKHYGKTEGVVAYHGYQSFAIGEATPEMAHEIGIKLAEKLWGDRFQVIVTTHLDKENHLHNHFVLNNVSMVDGMKYYRSEQDYYNMQKESDALCREYGLSVIENAKRGKSKHYAEWQAERNGKPTYRSTIKSDVDTAIRRSMTESQFWENIKKMGYHIKFGEDITLRAEGKERGLKLSRHFGDDYTIESIRRRILEQTRPEHPSPLQKTPPKKAQFKGIFQKTKRMTGLRALYFYYLYRMGVLPKKRKPTSKRVYFLLREDIRYTQNISREARLLAKHGIDTAPQLAEYMERQKAQISTLYTQRKLLRNQARAAKSKNGADNPKNETLEALKSEITTITDKLKELRREVRLCEDIGRRSNVMLEKLGKEKEQIKTKGKDEKRHEQFRRSR